MAALGTHPRKHWHRGNAVCWIGGPRGPCAESTVLSSHLHKKPPLDDNAISNLVPLADLTRLEKLRLGDNKISDLAPLARLMELRSLQLWGNDISDISSLAELTELESLSLAGNEISDIASLVENSDAGGLSAGHRVDLRKNHLDLTGGSQAGRSRH